MSDEPRPTAEEVEAEPWRVMWGDDPSWPGLSARPEEVASRIGATFGERTYVAEGALIACESLTVGKQCWIAHGTILRDRITIGDDCTLNPYVVMAGRVTLGDGVRIASFAALYGFNHGIDRLDIPIWIQDLDEQGITIGDEVWIGTHVVVCDGVTVGSHSVLGAGAVVTTDVPEWAIVGGVPARVIGDRRDRAGRGASKPRGDALGRFASTVEEQWRDLLDGARAAGERAHGPGPVGYVDPMATQDVVRPTCDAIELAAAFGAVEAAGPKAELVAWLQERQDPAGGHFLDPGVAPPDDPLRFDIGNEYPHYAVLTVGYALELLGAAPLHPVACVEHVPADELIARLDDLSWKELAWPAGAWIDFFGTATYLNRRYHGSTERLETLFGWLQTRVDRRTGMWGEPHQAWGWLMPVNGFYRLTRGTYAQFGQPLPEPEAAVDTVLAHCRDNRWFVDEQRNACNVLDVVHPLWLAARQVDYRRAEVRDAIAAMLADTLPRWEDGAGFAFEPGQPAGLQGTEMWLSIVHLMADHLSEADGLPWKPRGVHRLVPADELL